MEVFAYVFFCILLSSVSLIESNVAAEIEPENQLAELTPSDRAARTYGYWGWFWHRDPSSGYGFFWRENCNFENLDLPGMPFSSPSTAHCGLRCKEDNTCDHFTWQNNGNCWLKQGSFPQNKPVTGRSGFQCGFISSKNTIDVEILPGRMVMRENCDFSGREIGRKTTTTYEQCARECLKTDSCTKMVWNSVDTKCYLKENMEGGHTYSVWPEVWCGYFQYVSG